MATILKTAYYKALRLKHYIPARAIQISKDLPELPFTIVMMGYNNEEYIKKSIESALSQNYKNFTVIYNEACSTDSSAKILEEINHPKLTKRINKTRKYRLQNLYESIYETDDNQIILELDGDDYLKDEFVFDQFGKKYVLYSVNLKNGKT